MSNSCHFPGCNYSYYSNSKAPEGRHSFHRIPKDQTETVARFLNIELTGTGPLVICSDHFRDDAIQLTTDNRSFIKKGAPYIQLLKVSASSSSKENSPASAVSTRPPMSKKRKTFEDEEPSSPSLDEIPTRHCPSNYWPKIAENVVVEASGQAHSSSFSSSSKGMSTSSSASSIASDAKSTDDIVFLNEQLPRRSPIPEFLGNMRADIRRKADLAAKDREIAKLKEQIQKLTVANYGLLESNKSLSHDLQAYRAFVSKQLAPEEPIVKSPVQKPPIEVAAEEQRTPKTEQSQPCADEESELIADLVTMPSKKSLAEIRKWLMSLKTQC